MAFGSVQTPIFYDYSVEKGHNPVTRIGRKIHGMVQDLNFSRLGPIYMVMCDVS
jgi:hypothetical protein